MSTEENIDLLVAAQAATVKDIRATMSGNAGDAAGNAAAITALLAGQGFTSTNLLSAIFELASDIVSITIGNTDDVAEGVANLYYTDARVINAPLTAFVAGDQAVSINAADSVLTSLQKLEGLRATFGDYSVNDASITTTNLFSASHIDSELTAIASRPNTLTSFVSTVDVVATTDTIVDAVGKLQGQISDIDLTDLIDDTVTGLTTTWSSTEIDNRIQNVIDAAPAALDTLAELSAALNDDANFAGTVTAELGLKANSADIYTQAELGPNFTTRDWAAEWDTAIA